MWPGPPNSACPVFILSLAAMRHIPAFRQSPRLLPARLPTSRRVAVTDNISAFATRCSRNGCPESGCSESRSRQSCTGGLRGLRVAKSAAQLGATGGESGFDLISFSLHRCSGIREYRRSIYIFITSTLRTLATLAPAPRITGRRQCQRHGSAASNHRLG
jgi:hypothetical protein